MGGVEVLREGGGVPEAGLHDFSGFGNGDALGLGEEDEFGEASVGGLDAEKAGGADIEAGLLEQFAAEGGGEGFAVGGEAARETPSLVLPETMFKKKNAARIIAYDARDPVDILCMEEPCEQAAEGTADAIPEYRKQIGEGRV